MRMDRRQKLAYAAASEEIGLTEIPGHVDEPRIVEMFAKVGHDWVKDDETAWCAAAIGTWLLEAGLPHTGKLNARSYMDWGRPVPLDDAQPGDVVVFWRGSPDGWQGHVGFFVKHVGAHIDVLGGNQSNQVSVAAYPKSRLLGVRRYAARPAAAAPVGNPLVRLLNAIFSAIFPTKGGPA